MAADAAVPITSAPSTDARPVVVAEERFISGSDPCQGRAVRLARECQGLVVHGPPGTGKSQTITNIIGDHLARGQRVLVVCDKRTALDVVFNRLTHMGLGKLCALVHDPRRDQRELYKAIRQQLDELPQAASDPKAAAKLEKVDAELQGLHDELSRYRDALCRRDGEHGLTFHELVGQWLSLGDDAEARDLAEIGAVALRSLDASAVAVADVLRRGQSIAYGANPWVAATGMGLGDFLARPMDKVRAAAAACEAAARDADAAMDSAIPPFTPAPTPTLSQQAQARVTLAADLRRILPSTDPAVLARWAGQPLDALQAGKRRLDDAATFMQVFGAAPLDPELLANLRGQLPGLLIADQLLKLAAYQDVAGRWYGFLPLKPKSVAREILNQYGLALAPGNAERVRKFLLALRARTELSALNHILMGSHTPAPAALHADEVLQKNLAGHAAVLSLMTNARTNAALAGLSDRISAALLDTAKAASFLDGLDKSPARAAVLENFFKTVAASRLFEAGWLARKSADACAGGAMAPAFTSLGDRVETLEGVIRTRQVDLANCRPISKRPLGTCSKARCRPIAPSPCCGAKRLQQKFPLASRPIRICRRLTPIACKARSTGTGNSTKKSAVSRVTQLCTGGSRASRNGCWPRRELGSTPSARISVDGSCCAASGPCGCGKWSPSAPKLKGAIPCSMPARSGFAAPRPSRKSSRAKQSSMCWCLTRRRKCGWRSRCRCWCAASGS